MDIEQRRWPLKGQIDAISPLGDAFMTLMGRMALVWDARTNEIASMRVGPGSVTCAAFSPDGSLIATGDDMECLSVFDRSGQRKYFHAPSEKAGIKPLEQILSVAFSGDGDVLAGTSAGSVYLWHLGNAWRRKLADCALPVISISTHGRSACVVASTKVEGATAYFFSGLDELARFASVPFQIPLLASATYGDLAAIGGIHPWARVLDARSGQPVKTMDVDVAPRPEDFLEAMDPKFQVPEAVSALTFSHDGSVLAAAGAASKNVVCYETTTWAPCCTTGPFEEIVTALAYTEAGHLIVPAAHEGVGGGYSELYCDHCRQE